MTHLDHDDIGSHALKNALEIIIAHHKLIHITHATHRSVQPLLGRALARTLEDRIRAETDTWQRELLDDDRETRQNRAS